MKPNAERQAQAWIAKPKASCWYCNRHLNEVRRFCDNACAAAFDEDDMAMQRHMLAKREVPAAAVSA